MKHYSILDTSGKAIAQNLAKECETCISNCQSLAKMIDVCPKYGSKRRLGKIENNRGQVFLCCDKTKTTKLFKEKLNVLGYAYHDLIQTKLEFEEEVKKLEQQRVNRLVHNLTSINAHNIQEIYDLVPQDILASDHKNQITHIISELAKDPRKAALMFLRIAKHNIHMKSEFSIYKKLDRSDSKLETRNHPIRKVILNVLHTFFSDFYDKHINVVIGEFDGQVKIDYESVQVALYHLIENASKYTKPNSTIYIHFIDELDSVNVVFKMTSLYIEEDEREKIMVEGFSGRNAKKTNKSGDGIGMWRIEQMIRLNGGQIKVESGGDIEMVMGFKFAENRFVLNFKKY